jgi:SOS-response transcriptional repressor LexA
MTDKWELVLRFIKAYQKLHGVTPSYEVLAKGLGMRSRSNMHRIVWRLEQEGHLQIKPRKFHGIKVEDKSVKEIVAL